MFSEDGFSVTRKKVQSPSPPIDTTSCPTCGLSRYRRQPASSHSTGGYVSGVSPSPSELALPNTAFSAQQLDLVDSLTFQVQL